MQYHSTWRLLYLSRRCHLADYGWRFDIRASSRTPTNRTEGTTISWFHSRDPKVWNSGHWPNSTIENRQRKRWMGKRPPEKEHTATGFLVLPFWCSLCSTEKSCWIFCLLMALCGSINQTGLYSYYSCAQSYWLRGSDFPSVEPETKQNM